jgi:hypothetical protein
LTMKMSKRIKVIEAQNGKLKVAHAKSVAFAEAVTQWATTDLGATPSAIKAATATAATPSTAEVAGGAGGGCGESGGDSAAGAASAASASGASGGAAADGSGGTSGVDLMAELSKWKAVVASAEEARAQGLTALQAAHAKAEASKNDEVQKLQGQLRAMRLDLAAVKQGQHQQNQHQQQAVESVGGASGGAVGGEGAAGAVVAHPLAVGNMGGDGHGSSSSSGILVETLQQELQVLEKDVQEARAAAVAATNTAQSQTSKAVGLESQVR